MSKIPKTVFQTSKVKVDPYVVNMIMSKLTPEWEYLHFTDADILKFFKDNYVEEFKYITNKFFEIQNGAHRADLFRYYYIFVHGGVFIDSDAMIKVNIENIVKDYDFFSVNSLCVQNSIFQGLIGGTKNNEIIYKALVSAYNSTQRDRNDYSFFVKDLFKIYHGNNFTCKKRLYVEMFNQGIKTASTFDNNNVILVHYFATKTVPKE